MNMDFQKSQQPRGFLDLKGSLAQTKAHSTGPDQAKPAWALVNERVGPLSLEASMWALAWTTQAAWALDQSLGLVRREIKPMGFGALSSEPSKIQSVVWTAEGNCAD
jgi:hypothetical protein